MILAHLGRKYSSSTYQKTGKELNRKPSEFDNKKQQSDPLVPFCEISVCLSQEHATHANDFGHTPVTPQSHAL
jgi:hypothetical protein